MATANHPLQKLLSTAGTFVVNQKGKWQHQDWEAFMAKVEDMGLSLTDEGKRNLGNLLEASKHFYQALPAAAPKKKAAATKPKAKPKAKKA